MPPLPPNLIRETDEARLTPERRRERVIDFAYGNAALENPRITREMVRRAYDRLHEADVTG